MPISRGNTFAIATRSDGARSFSGIAVWVTHSSVSVWGHICRSFRIVRSSGGLGIVLRLTDVFGFFEWLLGRCRRFSM